MLTGELSRLSNDDKAAILSRTGVDLSRATEAAMGIIAEVRSRGDSALLRFAMQFESFQGKSFRVDESEISRSTDEIPKELLKALKLARSRIERFHRRQSLKPFSYSDECGEFGQMVVPLERVGVYVPGGTATYSSSVLMACVPARVAGVKELAICTPNRSGRVDQAVLAAAALCEVDEVYAVGGAHAVAAMAYGTQTIPRVQKIVGPGGAYVTAAKLLVRNDCEIDFPAGPSEVLILADAAADPRTIALEMLAQLEHDPLARAVVVSTSKKVLSGVSEELSGMIKSAERAVVVSESAESGAILLLADNMSQAIDFANEYAAEHVLILARDPKRVMRRIRNAGSVFLGESSSVSFGDYCSGTNHILPTMGTASSRSGLSTYDFVKLIPYQKLTKAGAAALSSAADTLATSEGLPAHAETARFRRRTL